MENVVYMLIPKLMSLGLFDILIFVFVLALMYAILRKSKILGENQIINGIISFSIAFMVLAFPVLTGIGLTMPISKFFTQASIFFLIFLIGFLLASMFYPNLMEWLPKVFTSRHALYVMIVIGIVLFITSGLVGVLIQSASNGLTGGPVDLIVMIVGLLILIVVVIVASVRGEI